LGRVSGYFQHSVSDRISNPVSKKAGLSSRISGASQIITFLILLISFSQVLGIQGALVRVLLARIRQKGFFLRIPIRIHNTDYNNVAVLYMSQTVTLPVTFYR
jgi:hypothetical protein